MSQILIELSLNLTEHGIKLLIIVFVKIKNFLALKLSDVVIFLIISVKKSTFVGILIFMSRLNVRVLQLR